MAVDRWWNKWNDYVDINKTVSTNEGSSSEHQDSVSASTPKRPSSIDNSVLINEEASNSTIGIELHDTLQEHTDYILVPEETWNQFCAWLVWLLIFSLVLIYLDIVGVVVALIENMSLNQAQFPVIQTGFAKIFLHVTKTIQ